MADGAIWWPNWKQIQVVPSDGTIYNSPQQNPEFLQVIEADNLDRVIQRHNLPVERYFNYEQNSSGSCWYASIAALINIKLAEGKMSLAELKMSARSPVSHDEVRLTVCNFLASDECIMKEFWIKEHFDGKKDRYLFFDKSLKSHFLYCDFQILPICRTAQGRKGMD